MKSDHCIITNNQGDMAIYRGLNLAELVRAVADAELEEVPLGLANNPTLVELEDLLLEVDIGMVYDAPRIY